MEDYFHWLVEKTATRVWVNNPTMEEVDLALAKGAVGCTTNPAYAGGLLSRAPAEVTPIVAETTRAFADEPTNVIVEVVQRRLVARIAEAFGPMYEATDGREGFVSIQGAPESDTNGESIWREVEANHTIAPNAIAKIPGTLPGFVAFERTVEKGWPVIITEVFSLDQIVAACERYLAITETTGLRPRVFVACITGILGDHLKTVSAACGLNISAEESELAGVYVARRCAELVAKRQYPVTLLFGGARTTADLTGLVGAAHHATINWTTFAEVLSLNPPREYTIARGPDPAIARRLLNAFPDVWKGWELGRLEPEEFETFAPVLHFRNNFISGWNALQTEVERQRAALVREGAHQVGR